MATVGDVSNSYFFIDSDWGNPHVLLAARSIQSSLNGLVFGQGGTGLNPPGDSGEFTFLSDSAAPTTYGLYNSILLPNMAGYSSLEIGSMAPSYPNTKAIVEHNTWFGGWNRGTHVGDVGFGALQVGEGGNGAAGSIVSFRSNILWNPQLAGFSSSFFKLSDLSATASPTLDYCAPAECDYNTGFGFTPTNTTTPQYTRQAKGYAARFSGAPGVHDVDADPMFVDWQRTVELFDSKYLGNRPTAWSSAATYVAGSFVQHSRTDVYWSLPVNYRYVNGGACAGTNPEPGFGTNWRDCWEWASLYRLREGVGIKMTFTDGALVIPGDSLCREGAKLGMIEATMCWIRAGHVVNNFAVWGKSHDGQDNGAVRASNLGHGLALGLP